MPEKHAERRRSVFWELYTLDKWKVCTCSLKCRTFPLCLLVCSQSLWAPEGPLFSACMKWTANFQKKLRRRPTKTAKYCTVVSFFIHVSRKSPTGSLLISKLLVYHWKHDFAKQVTSSVASKLCTVSPMKYSEILELDRKVREHPGFSAEYLDKLDTGGSPETFQALAVTLYREISVFHYS